MIFYKFTKILRFPESIKFFGISGPALPKCFPLQTQKERNMYILPYNY